MMRIRTNGNNYKAIFTNSYKTLRLGPGVPDTPELEDVAINNKCLANCPYCYTNAMKSGVNFTNISEKAWEVWGLLEEGRRPFQIAIGGAGEPTMHPNFISFLEDVRHLGIVPNFTTNGMHLTDAILDASERLCGGIALSWHPHIKKTFHAAVERLNGLKTKLNFHVILGTTESFEDLQRLSLKYLHLVDYMVILPYQAVGRGVPIKELTDVWDKTFEWISNMDVLSQQKFAFGALFYDYFIAHPPKFDLSLYNPDIYSGYRILDDEQYKTVYKSSYDFTPK